MNRFKVVIINGEQHLLYRESSWVWRDGRWYDSEGKTDDKTTKQFEGMILKEFDYY